VSDRPTSGATEPTASWSRSPIAARGLRAVAYLLPVVTAWLAVRATSDLYYRPDGWAGLAAWLVQAITVSVIVSSVVDRLSRRLLPLAVLMNLSLAFPDQAPSRFSMALRAGSTRQLTTRLDQIASEGLGTDPQEAAGRALELVAALANHDRRTRGHTERVRANADLIAEELGLRQNDRWRLAWGVLLHDIGKLTVPAEILNKESALTEAEWAVLRRHPAAGRQMLEPLTGWLDDWIRAAGDHHERWDGTGYPDGLAGTDISLAGRITAVADAFDVITSARSYKQPLSPTAAREELVRCSGTQFDPSVVRAFLAVSMGRRWNGGPLAWLAELPSLGRFTTTLANSAGTISIASAAFVASLAGVGGVTDHPPGDLAMVETRELVVEPASTPINRPTNDSAASLGTELSATPVVSEPATTAPPTTATATSPVTTAGANSSTTTTATTMAAPAVAKTSPPTTASPSSARPTSARPTSARPTTPGPTTTVAPATAPAAAPPGGRVWYLTNPGSGDTRAATMLTLFGTAPSASSLPNYDTDRDTVAGLSIKHDSRGLDATDTRAYQEWSASYSNSATLSGTATATMYLGGRDLSGSNAVGLRVGLYRCSWTCTLMASGDWTGTSQDGVFQPVTVPLGSVQISLSWGTRLVVKVAAPNSLSTSDISLAYDTAAHPAVLTIG
jgi:HD-GYP domain-containing protein (c-di-GMP phosphodiesterase class II)